MSCAHRLLLVLLLSSVARVSCEVAVRNSLTLSSSLLRCTLSSLFPVLHVLKSLLLYLIDELELWILTSDLGEVELLGVVADHGWTAQSLPEVLCARADAGGVVGRLEDGAAKAGEGGKAGGHGGSAINNAKQPFLRLPFRAIASCHSASDAALTSALTSAKRDSDTPLVVVLLLKTIANPVK